MQKRAAGACRTIDDLFRQDLKVLAVVGVFITQDADRAQPAMADANDLIAFAQGTNGDRADRGLSPGTSPPPVRIPIKPFLVLMRPLCPFLRASKRKIDASDWMCKRHRSDETVFRVTNSQHHANPSRNRVFFRRRCTDSTLQRITTAKLKVETRSSSSAGLERSSTIVSRFDA